MVKRFGLLKLATFSKTAGATVLAALPPRAANKSSLLAARAPWWPSTRKMGKSFGKNECRILGAKFRAGVTPNLSWWMTKMFIALLEGNRGPWQRWIGKPER